MDEEFDVAHSTHLSRAEGVGHAFSFVYTRVMHGEVVPHVPIMLNTYYPPNQPRPGRCYDLRLAIKRAVESWDSEARVAVSASGWLSQFVLTEELLGAVLA